MAERGSKTLLSRLQREARRVGTRVGLMQPYQPEFYGGFAETARASARVVLPLVRSWLNPLSVVDVGCGAGVWLGVWRELGVHAVLGIDGDYVRPEQLEIPRDRFRAADLNQPLAVQERFDLAMCLEVVEHLPPAAGDTVVSSLCSLADAVLFSAAIPGQGGTGHVHEQWPDYWCERFAREGLVAVDALRPAVWNDERVSWWYRQNTLLFVRPARLAQHPALGALARSGLSTAGPLSIAHPRLVEHLVRAK